MLADPGWAWIWGGKHGGGAPFDPFRGQMSCSAALDKHERGGTGTWPPVGAELHTRPARSGPFSQDLRGVWDRN